MKKFLIILIALSLIFPFSVLAATYTKQPSAKDNHFYQGRPDENNGDITYLWFRRVAGTETWDILNFNISDLPAGAVISSAKLYLYYYDISDADPVGESVDAYKITRDNWTELGSTWNKYDGTNNWTTPGGDYVTSNPAGGNTTFPASFGWMSWEIKAIVEDAIANVGSSVNVIVKGTTTDTAGASFYSNNYTTDTSLRPKLVIEYTVPSKRRIFIISFLKDLLKNNLTYVM